MSLVGDIAGGVFVVGASFVGAETLPEVTQDALGEDMPAWMVYTYRMTLAIVPVLVALIYTRRKKRKAE